MSHMLVLPALGKCHMRKHFNGTSKHGELFQTAQFGQIKKFGQAGLAWQIYTAPASRVLKSLAEGFYGAKSRLIYIYRCDRSIEMRKILPRERIDTLGKSQTL